MSTVIQRRNSSGKAAGFRPHPFIIAAAICAPIFVQPVAAQSVASKPVRLVVPFPPGGAADIVARVIGRPLSDTLGQPVIVENRPGADGAIAAEAVAKADPDGSTLFMATYGAMSAVPALHKHVPYDVNTDFTPIAEAGTFSIFLFVHPSVPVKTLSELIDYAHHHPGSLNYGTGNVGAIVATAELSSVAKMAMVHVPYKGEVPAMADFLTGRVQLMFATPSNTLSEVKEGKLRALVTLSDSRSPLLPQVPTMGESGMRSLPVDFWAGVFGPAKMSGPLTQHLSLAINAILKRDDVRGDLARQGLDPHGSTPEQLAVYVRDQLQVWGRAIHNAGIEID